MDNSKQHFYHSDFFLSAKLRFEHDESVKPETGFYIHDSVNHVRKDQVKKKMFSNRDLGSKIFSAPAGASYRFNDYVLSFFPYKVLGVGYLSEGEFIFGIGRHNVIDDDKGLPSGTPDESDWNFNLQFGLFKKDEIFTRSY